MLNGRSSKEVAYMAFVGEILLQYFVPHKLKDNTIQNCVWEIVYGRELPGLHDYSRGGSHVDSVDFALEQRDKFFKMTRERLLEAKQQMKASYDNHHRAIEFKVGDWMWLKIHPYSTIDNRYGFYKAFSKVLRSIWST